jgi:hypothetical protein
MEDRGLNNCGFTKLRPRTNRCKEGEAISTLLARETYGVEGRETAEEKMLLPTCLARWYLCTVG